MNVRIMNKLIPKHVKDKLLFYLIAINVSNAWLVTFEFEMESFFIIYYYNYIELMIHAKHRMPTNVLIIL